MATSAPALIGLSVAALYAVGVIYEINALRDAGLRVAEVFPLIPLEDHLLRGAAVLLRPGTVLVVAAYAGALLFIAVRPPRRSGESGSSRLGPTARTVIITGVACLSFTLAEPPWPILVYAVVGFVSAAAVSRFLVSRTSTTVAGVVALSAAFSVGNFVQAYVDPPKLSPAEVKLDRGGTIRGAYVAVRENTVVLAGARGAFQRVPLADVATVDVRPPSSDCEPGLLNLLGIPHPNQHCP